MGKIDNDKVLIVEHILGTGGLAKFHGEPNLKFYKELCEEIFCKYAGFDDYAAGANTLQSLISKSFKKIWVWFIIKNGSLGKAGWRFLE